MKAFIIVLIWTIFFTISGFYLQFKLNDFINTYENKISTLETFIENDDYKGAKETLINISKDWHKERVLWYRLLDHTYFDDICFYLNVIDKGIDLKNKSMTLEYLEKIKNCFNNIIQNENVDLNHIF